MKHFLITRFNIKSDVWLHTKSGALTNTETWLEQRFTLFETYCLPSVKHQSNKKFKWYVVFDVDTPKVFKKRIEVFADSYDNLTPLYTKSFHTLKTTLTEAILQELTIDDDFIITTRLDNDDAIHQDFVDCIHQEFVQQHNTIIDITRGYQLIVNENNYDARYYTSNYNPFISLIENSQQFETVMAKNHEHWKALSNRIIYNDQSLWLQVIHSDNILNSKINTLKKVNQLDFEMFGLSNIKIEDNQLKNMIFNLTMAPLHFWVQLKGKLKSLIK